MGAASAVEDSALNNTISEMSSGDVQSVPLAESAGNEVLSATHDLSGSAVQDIKNLFDGGTVQEGDTVYLGNQSISSGWSEWNGNQVINVNVPNVIISGGSSSNPDGFSTINANQAKVFSFNAAGITLKNVKIVNSHGGNGPASAVYIDASDCTIDNCVFDSCQVNQGGAIHGSSSATNTMISNCNFTNNEARWGGSGGAIYFEGSANEIDGCNFDSNTAQNYGAVYSAGTLTVRNSNFTNNKGGNANGGAVHIAGANSVVDNCNFIGNEVTAGHLSGGAIALTGSGSSITNSNFESNKAGQGGAVSIQASNINVDNCNFTDNSATSNGGAIYIADNCNNADMSNCNFEDNNAASGKAIYAAGSGNGKVSNCNLGGVTDLSVLGGYPELTFTLATDYSNIVVGNIEGASGDGSKVPLVGEEIKLDIYDLDGNFIKTVTLNETDDNGQTKYDYSDLPLGKYKYTATYLDGKTKEGTFGVTIVEGDGFSSIKNAINSAEPGEVLILKDKTYLNDIDDSMVIDKPIAIVGNGAVLDAEGKSRIFTINENIKGVNLENITFINGNSADNGGAIYIGNNADGGRIVNSTFRDNTAQVGGGAIKNERAYDWIVDDCIFIHNIAESTLEDDTSKVPNGGGAIWSCDSLTRIYNSTFINNEAGYGGAVRGFVDTYNSEFYFNVAFDGNGGGIDVTINLAGVQWPTLEFINTTLVNNTANGKRSNDRAQGGAIHTYHIDHVDMIDCKIYNNTADRGGAVDLYIINSVFVDNCDIENNTAHSEGGGFYINASSELNRTNEFRNTNITKNDAGTEGGALYLITNNALFDNIIANNNSAARGGAAFVRGDNATVQYSTFNNNEAFRNESSISGRGGALNIWGKNCKLINVTANKNTADRGGSAFIRGDDTYVVNSSFDGNTAHIRGGGLNVGNGTNIRIINVTVSDNWANTTGGGIFVLADGTTFFNVTADNNTAQNGGGAYIEGNHVRIELGEFNNNTALYNGTYDTGLGGALDVKGNGCTVVNLTSNDNKGYRGGSTFIRGSDTTVINCTMDNNNATFRGGALNIGGGNNAKIINVSVSNNRAKDEAGAVYVVGDHSLFDNFTAINNTANMGGGFEIEGDDTTIQNSTIRNNTAVNGGGMYITGDDVFLFNNNITFNRALDPTDEAYCNGGGVAIEASSYDSLVNFTNNNISSNYAQDNGGGVFIFVMSGEVYMDNVTAYYNTAENGGFCHVMCCENLVVKNSTFDSNHATGDIFGYPDRGEGGAFHISNELNFLIDSSALIQGNFYNNTAMNGSSIYIQDSSLKVYNSTFYDNQAHSYYLPIVPLNNTKFNQTDDITISVRLQGGDNIANAIHNKDGACEVLVYNITYPFYTIDGKVIDKQTPSRYMAPVVGPNAEDIYLYDFENNQVITLILYTGAGNFTYNEATGEYVYNGNGSEVNRFDYIVQPIFEADHVDDKIIVNRSGKNTVFTYDPDSGMYIHNKSGSITSLQVSPKGDSMEYTFNKSGAITKVYYNSTSDEYVFNESGIVTKVKYNETTGIYSFNKSGKVSNYYSINKTNINGTVNVPLTQLKGILDPGKYTVLALYRESTYYTEIYNYTTFIVKGLVEKLTVNKTVGLGDNVDFVVTVTNQYNYTLHNVTITEIFKTSELKYLDYTNKGNWTIGNITTYNVTISKNNVVNYTSIVFKYKGNLSANQSTNFTITFKTLKLGTLVNTVNLTTNETKDFILTAKNETLVINLVEKLTVNETVVLGDNVDFVVVVSNRENMTLHNVTVTEIFRTSELQYVNYTNQGNWTIGKITTYNVTLPGEGLVNFTSIVFTYKCNLSAYNNTNFTITFKTLKTGTLVNTVNLTTNETGSKIFNATNTTLVYKLLEKLTVNETVRVGENVSFTVVVNNLENRTLHNVTVTEIFRTSELQYVNYTNQGNWTIGKITTYNVTLPGEGLVNFTNIVFTYKGNLSANQSTNFTITFNAKVNGTLVNTVNLTTNETGSKIFNATNTTTVINNKIANLTVTKLALNTTVVVGDRVYFMVVVNNTGDFALGNVTVHEIYDFGKLTLVDYNNHDLWERKGDVFTYKGVLDVNKTANFTVWFITKVNGTVVNTVNASSNLTGNKTAKNDTLVISPNMTVTKLALNKTVVIGDKVYFMVVVNNNGDCDLADVVVSEIYDSGKLTLVDYDNHDLWDVKGDVFIYNGVLARGESANFTVWFTTNVNGTVVNTVNASSNLTGNKSAVNDTLVISPNMAVTKLALNKTVVIGDKVYFMVVVTNTGDCDLSNVTVSEIYDSGKLTLVDYDDHDLWDVKGDVFTYNGVLARGESANFTVWFTANVNGTVVNTVNASSNLTENKSASNDTLVISPNMTVTKLALNTTVVIGNNVYFMVVVNNNGDCDLADVVVTEIYDSGKLTLVDYDNHDLWDLKDDVFNYKGVLAAGESANFTVWFTANVNGTIINTVNASSNLTENKTSSNETKVINPDMTVEKLTVNKTVIVGDKVIFTIVVTNTGDTVLGNISVKENIPEGLSYGTFHGPGWEKVGDYIFNYTGELAPGVSTSFNITLNADEGGLWENSVVASSNMTDDETAENTTFVHGPGIEVEKYALNATVVMGDYVYFMIVVNNTGDYPLHDVRVTEIFDSDELDYVNHTDRSVWIKSGNVFSYNGVLAVNGSANFTVWFTTKVNGTIVNTVNATSRETGNVTTHNETLVINPHMTVQKLFLNRTVYIDEKVIFTIVVTNTGDCDLGNISVREVIPDGLTYEAISGDDWIEAGDYVFNYTATLTPGNSTSFNITFIAHEGGNWTNTVIAESNMTEDVVANNTTYVMGPGLDVSKVSLNTTTIVIGDYAYFMITVKNTGDCDLGDVTVVEFFNSNELEYVNHTDRTVWVKEDNAFKYQGVLSEGASSNFTVGFRTLTNGVLVNNVTAKSNVTEDLNSSANVTVISPDMTVEKLALNTTVVVGNDVYFMIVVTNTGDCDLADVVVTEIYDSAKLTLVDFDNKNLWNLTCDVFTYNGVLAAGESANFTVWFTAKVNGTIANTVNASSNMTENRTANNETLVVNPDMTVQKLTVNKTVMVDDKVIFTIVVTNTGDCDLGDISIRENIPEGLSYSTFYGPGWEEVGDYIFNYTGILAPGVSASFNITLNANEGGLWENSVAASSNLTEEKTAKNTTFVHGPGIEVEKYALNATVVMGDHVYYMIVVNNTGDHPLHDVRVSEIFNSDEMTYVNHTDSSLWTKTGDVFTYNGVLAVNESASFTIWFTAKVNGTIVNTVNATSKETKNVTTHNSTLVVNPDMTVEKITLNETVVIGDDVYFMIVVTNTGDCDLSDVVVKESYSSDELTLKDFSNKDLWTRSSDVFTYNGVLAPGESANFTVWFTTKVNGTVVNTVNASSNMTENKTSKNTTDVEKELCDLEISKLVSASDVYVNHFVEWTIIVVNNGPFTAKDVIVNDTLPQGIEIISCSHAYEQKGDSLIWKLGDVEVNDPVEIMLFTRVLGEGELENFVCVNTTTDESDYDNNNASNTTFVNPICDLIINKTVNASNVYVNDSVEWTITVINVGPSIALNVKVADTLPEGAVILSYDTHSVGSFDEETRIWEIGQLNANEPVSLVLVTKIIAEGRITNVVTVNTTTTESDETNNAANNTTVADPVCDLIITKAVNASSIHTGDSVEWTIAVVNVGPSAAENVKVTDILPQGTVILAYDTHSVGSFDEETRIWEIGQLNANEPVSLVLVTKILTDGNITNKASVDTSTYEPDKTNNEANNTTVANPICDLEIVKVADSITVNINENVIWTIIVTNHGPSAALNVVVEDVLPDSLTLIGTKASVGSYSNGIWMIGNLGVNASETLELTTQAVELGTITNVASVNSTTPDSDESNNKAQNTTEVLPVCDLEITKLVNASSVDVKGLVEWTITVVNNGPCTARDVTVSDVLPDGLKLISATPSVGSYTDGIWTIGDLTSSSSQTLVLITQVLNEGPVENIVTVDSTTPDSDKSNNKANNTTVANPVCDLEVIKLVATKKAYVGNELIWTIIVTNNGPSQAKDVKVSENIPSSLEFVRYAATKGTYDKNSQIWTIGELDNASSVTLTLVTKVLSVGNITNPVEVTTTTPDSDKTNNKANNTTEAFEICDVAIVMSTDKKVYHVGDEMHWIMEVVNYGPSPAKDVVVSDVLPEGVKFISSSASKGSYSQYTGEWNIGDLAVGEKVTIDILCKVMAEGVIVNHARVSTSTNESDLTNNQDNASVKVIKNEPHVDPDEPDEPTPEPDEPISTEPPVEMTMRNTGNPIVYLLAAIFAIFGSFWVYRKEE